MNLATTYLGAGTLGSQLAVNRLHQPGGELRQGELLPRPAPNLPLPRHLLGGAEEVLLHLPLLNPLHPGRLQWRLVWNGNNTVLMLEMLADLFPSYHDLREKDSFGRDLSLPRILDCSFFIFFSSFFLCFLSSFSILSRSANN